MPAHNLHRQAIGGSKDYGTGSSREVWDKDASPGHGRWAANGSCGKCCSRIINIVLLAPNCHPACYLFPAATTDHYSYHYPNSLRILSVDKSDS